MKYNHLIPGTTVTAAFVLPVDAAEVKVLTLDYSQNGQHLFTKTKTDCALAGTAGTVKLTQEDTLKLADNTLTKVQIGLLTEGDETIFSYSYTFMTAERVNRVVLK